MRTMRFALLLFACVPLWGQYPWIVSDSYPVSPSGGGVNPNEWNTTGDPVSQNGAYGLTTDSSASTLTPVPALTPSGGWTDYEIQATIAPYNGTVSLYARMSSDMTSYYSLSIYTSGATVQATLWKVLSGTPTALLSFYCSHQAAVGVLARLIVHGSRIIAYIGNLPAQVVQDSSLASGQPGIGLTYGPDITTDAIGPIDTVPPSTPTNVQVLPLQNGVNLAWTASSDGSTGIGLAGYLIYQDGAYLGQTSFDAVHGRNGGTGHEYHIHHLRGELALGRVVRGDDEPKPAHHAVGECAGSHKKRRTLQRGVLGCGG